jgi:hypothetical protein
MVVDQQHAGRAGRLEFGRRGGRPPAAATTSADSASQNREPSPSVLATPIWPPIWVTSALLIARPSPAPP